MKCGGYYDASVRPNVPTGGGGCIRKINCKENGRVIRLLVGKHYRILKLIIGYLHK